MTRKYNLDTEEQEILELFESGNLRSTYNVEQDKTFAKKLATEHNKKNARINIRISQFDLDRLKRIAAKEGMPYQTLISSGDRSGEKILYIRKRRLQKGRR